MKKKDKIHWKFTFSEFQDDLGKSGDQVAYITGSIGPFITPIRINASRLNGIEEKSMASLMKKEVEKAKTRLKKFVYRAIENRNK